MIKVLIFDFDGIILESSQIKTEAYRTLFRNEESLVFERIMNYHLLNMGFSRQRIFRYYYEEIKGMKVTDDTIEEMSQAFNEIVLSKVLEAPYVPGILDFLHTVQHEYNLYIATGTPESDIKQIVKKRNLETFFKGVYGSPLEKEHIIEKILLEESITQKEALLFGDAESDRLGAENTNINFIGRMGPGPFHMKWTKYVIKDFSDTEDICEIINTLGKNA